MRFVQLLPSHLTDARTYNMLVSVCIAARDLPMALKAGTMLKEAGKQLDTFLYTNLITACAVDGDAEMGFRLYEEMLADRVPTDPRVYTALISVCSGKIRMTNNDSGRRGQLVLLERAFGVFHDMQVSLQRSAERTTRNDAVVGHEWGMNQAKPVADSSFPLEYDLMPCSASIALLSSLQWILRGLCSLPACASLASAFKCISY